jgi:hypothetical protein
MPRFDLPLAAEDGRAPRITSGDLRGSWLLLLYEPGSLVRTAVTSARMRHALDPSWPVAILAVSGTVRPGERVRIPVARDPSRRLARALGLAPGARATYLVDPDGIVRFAGVEDASLPPPTAQALLALDAALGAGAAPVTALESMCAWCRRVLSAEGSWERLESFVAKRAGVEFTHGICGPCLDTQKRRVATGGGAERPRRSPRVPLEMPVRLSRRGASWTARTAVVNREGALVLSPVPLRERETIRITRGHGQTAMCRVAWCGGEVAPGLHQVGLELIDPSPAFWGPAYERGRPAA